MNETFTDDEVLAAVGKWARAPTYVVANILNAQTPKVLRALKRLEKSGKVKRVDTSYAVMLAWSRSDQ